MRSSWPSRLVDSQESQLLMVAIVKIDLGLAVGFGTNLLPSVGLLTACRLQSMGDNQSDPRSSRVAAPRRWR